MIVYPRYRGVLWITTIVAVPVVLVSTPSAYHPQTSAHAQTGAAAQPRPSRPTPRGMGPTSQQTADNGISVGRPKIFDNRALTIMIEEWQKALRNTQLVDQTKLAAAFGMFQGSSTREVSSAVSATTLPMPQSSNKVVTNTGIVDDNGNPLPDTSQQTTDTSRAAFTPQAPSLDALPPFSGLTPTFGQHPSDLLSDQVNLTYQIFNLRMLLERSLSDRLLSESTGHARRQAVVGFNVTVDPPRTAEDSVAVVEVTLTSTEADKQDGLSLVSMMPQEKTYNATALSTEQNAFGGAAVAGMFTVGYSQRRRGQDFYVYRDADTVAYERVPEEESPGTAANDGTLHVARNRIVFGWMFRPVLGRKAVSPGLRQMFAVISLPNGDRLQDAEDAQLTATIRTYWKKYDRDTMTSFEVRDANRAARLRYFLSATLAKPEIFNPRYVSTRVHDGIVVKATAKYDADLHPTLTNVRWTLVGPKTVVIAAEGDNFFSGTQVTVAGKTYAGNGDGLLLKSNQAFDLTTGIEAIESGVGSIIGRYGAAVDLRHPCSAPGANQSSAPVPSLGTTMIGREQGGWRRIAVEVKNNPSHCSQSPVLSVNGNVLPLPYQAVGKGGNVTEFSTFAEASVLGGRGGRLKVSWPFMATSWTLYDVLHDPDADYQYSKIGDNVLLLTATNNLAFDVNSESPESTEVCWTILSQAGEMLLRTPKCANGSQSSTSLSRTAVKVTLDKPVPERLVLLSPWKSTFVLELTKAGGDAPKEPKPLTVAQFDAVWLQVPVKDARKVAKVEANGKELRKQFMESGDGNAPISALNVELTRDLTKDPGSIDLTFWDARGQLTGETRVTITCGKCSAQEK
jgi:hypothetical protein